MTTVGIAEQEYTNMSFDVKGIRLANVVYFGKSSVCLL